MIPAEMIIREHYRLGSTCAILSRSFCNVDKIEHLGVISSTFVNGIREIRAFEEKCQEHIGYFMDNKWELEKFVKKIIQQESNNQMNLLVTGAFAWTEDELNKLKQLGHEVIFMQQER